MIRARKLIIMAAAGSLSLLIAGMGWARPCPSGMGHGRHGGGWGGEGPMMKGGHPAARPLMHAPPEMLKTTLGLNDVQLGRIQGARNDFQSKQIKLRAQLQQYQLELQQVLQADQPNQAKAVELVRKISATRAQIAEERMKTQLKLLSELTPAQRAKLRSEFAGPHGGRGMMGGYPCMQGGKDCPHHKGALGNCPCMGGAAGASAKGAPAKPGK